MMFYLTADMEFACTDPARDTDGNFEAFLDAVAEALADLEDVDPGITSADLTGTITKRRAAIDMAIEADTVMTPSGCSWPIPGLHSTPRAAARRIGPHTSRSCRTRRSGK